MEEIRIKNHEKGKWTDTDYFTGSQTVVPEPAVSASPVNLTEMQIWGPHTKLTELETLRAESINM